MLLEWQSSLMELNFPAPLVLGTTFPLREAGKDGKKKKLRTWECSNNFRNSDLDWRG